MTLRAPPNKMQARCVFMMNLWIEVVCVKGFAARIILAADYSSPGSRAGWKDPD